MAEQTGLQSYVATLSGELVAPPENGPPDVVASRLVIVDSRDRDRSVWPNPSTFRVALPNYAGVIGRVNLVSMVVPIPQGVTEHYFVLGVQELEPCLETAEPTNSSGVGAPTATAPLAGRFAAVPFSTAPGSTYVYEAPGIFGKASVLGFERSRLELLNIQLLVRNGSRLAPFPYVDELPATDPAQLSPDNNWMMVLEVIAHE